MNAGARDTATGTRETSPELGENEIGTCGTYSGIRGPIAARCGTETGICGTFAVRKLGPGVGPSNGG